MKKQLVIAGFGFLLLGSLPAYAQVFPELDGAPPPLKVDKPTPAPPKSKIVAPPVAPVAPKVAKPVAPASGLDQASLARQAAGQKAEQVRLAQLAADLKAREGELDARAVALAAEEKRLAKVRGDQELDLAAQRAELVAQKAELARQSDDVARQLAQARLDGNEARGDVSAPIARAPSARRPNTGGLDLATAKESCTAAAEDEARARSYFSAEYDGALRFTQGRSLELRGAMRLEDRRGYRIVDTVCEIDADGEAQNFTFLR